MIRLGSVPLHSRTQEFWRSHQINRRCQNILAKRNLELKENLINNHTFLMEDTSKG